MNFTDRTSYVSWAAEWKAGYREASTHLRTLKLAFKKAQRESAWSTESKLRGDIQAAKSAANQMLSDRHASKEEAQRQFLLARSPTTA